MTGSRPLTAPTPAPGPILRLLAVAACLAWAVPATAERPDRHAAEGGVAVGGHDPVAFFNDGTAVPGDPAIALRWRGVRWHFATPAHRAAFEANPKAFAPAFGGHCPVSVAEGAPRPGDPRHWIIHEQRLFLLAGDGAAHRLREAPQELLAQARARWSAARAGRQ
ncbi:YHS domain-containing (seleno)protein [Rhodobaculum claviforme]|nr:YHS domain-containing (seleno)protein [Rhodobaculum claviforme]